MNWEADSLHNRQDIENTPHTIRLHGPWQCELNPSSEGATETLAVNLPVDWKIFLPGRLISSMTWKRIFGRPTNLSDRERVELVVTCLREGVRVWLNEKELEVECRDKEDSRFDVTNRLETRNHLVLSVHTPSSEIETANQPIEQGGPSNAGPFGRVRLDIHTAPRQSQ